ncbi:MAG: hypothetical protein FWG77_02020 [Treponema sp.]|nr:hypothetical protein [Treponema sp.]
MPYYNEALFKESLENSVYYPACANDGTPIKILGKMFSNFVYSDYFTDIKGLDYELSTSGLLGYRLENSTFLDAKELFGVDWNKYLELNKELVKKVRLEWNDPFIKLYSFRYRSYFANHKGKDNINILYVKSEGITAYKYLYVNRNISPKCLVSLNPGMSFGGNFDDYVEILTETIISSGKLPEYHFYSEEYSDLFKDLLKYYDCIEEYDCPNAESLHSTHFRLGKLRNDSTSR